MWLSREEQRRPDADPARHGQSCAEVAKNTAVFSNRLARIEDRPQSAGSDSYAPARLTMRLVGAPGVGLASSPSGSNSRNLGSPNTSRVTPQSRSGEQAWAPPTDRHHAIARPRKRPYRDPTDRASQWGPGTATGGCQAVVFDAVGKVAAAKWTATWVPAAPRVATAQLSGRQREKDEHSKAQSCARE